MDVGLSFFLVQRFSTLNLLFFISSVPDLGFHKLPILLNLSFRAFSIFLMAVDQRSGETLILVCLFLFSDVLLLNIRRTGRVN